MSAHPNHLIGYKSQLVKELYEIVIIKKEYQKKGISITKYIKLYLDKKGISLTKNEIETLRKNIYKYKKFIENSNGIPIDPKIKIEKDIEKLNKQEFKKLYNKHIKLIREFRKTNKLVEIISNNISPFPYKQAFKLKTGKYSKKLKSCVVNISDVHIGKEIESPEIGGITEFNNELIRSRLEKYLQTIIEYVNKNNTEKIYLNLLGDIIDNDSIYRGHINYISDQLVDQILIALDYFESFILNLLELTKRKIEIHCVYGNHGRKGKKDEYKYYNNFDYLLYKILERRFKNVKNIEFIIPLAWFDTYKIYDNEILLLHGDDIKAWMGIPYYGIERMSRKFTQALEKFYDIIILGHFHTASSITLQGKDIIINGSFDGGDVFSLKKLFTMNRPSQWMFFINEDGEIEERFKINFD